MTLREELARRLAETAGVIGHDLMTLNWSPVEDHDFWKTLADEVIRQMEWARHDGYGPGFKHGREYEAAGFPECNGLVDRDQFDDFPLTLAPPEWTP